MRHNQRFLPVANRLPPQHVEELGRRAGHHDLHVFVVAQPQEPLEPRAGVFGTLALEAVRQQEHDAAEMPPLLFGTDDELIDDHLGRVGEVAELGLP